MLNVSVWRSLVGGFAQEPVGQVTFPQPLVTSGQLEEEQWFPLATIDPENSVSGEVHVMTSYQPPDEPKTNLHRFHVSRKFWSGLMMTMMMMIIILTPACSDQRISSHGDSPRSTEPDPPEFGRQGESVHCRPCSSRPESDHHPTVAAIQIHLGSHNQGDFYIVCDVRISSRMIPIAPWSRSWRIWRSISRCGTCHRTARTFSWGTSPWERVRS